MAIEYIKISTSDITDLKTALKGHYSDLQTVATARANAGESPALESDWIVDGATNGDTGGYGTITGLAEVLVDSLLKKGYIDDDVS
jgi:hypothetical protein